MLQAARIAPPYILVGQSFSGFNVRVFAARYRHDVVGVVLMDSVQEDQQQYEASSTLAPVNRLPDSVRNVLCTAIPWAAKIGVLRLLLSTPGGPRDIPGFTASEVATLNALQSQPNAVVAAGGCKAWEKSANEARTAGALGSIPLFVLTAGKPMQMGDPVLDEELKRFHQTWVHKLQPRLVDLSTRGKQVVVENGSHDDGGDMALVAVRVIRELVRDTRR